MSKSILRIISIALVGIFTLSGMPSYAYTDNASDFTLAPPSAIQPQGDTPLRNEWIVATIGRLIYPILKLTQEGKFQNPTAILIPHIKKNVDMTEMSLRGFDIDGIEEVRESNEIKGFSLPVEKSGAPAYRLIYNLQSGQANVPMLDGTKVYIKTETLDAISLSKYELETRLTNLRKIISENPDELTEGDRQYLMEIAGYFNFYPDYLVKETGKEQLRRYAIPLSILSSAELVSLNLRQTSFFALSAIDEIGTAFFSHELSHIVGDIWSLSTILRQPFKDSVVKRDLVKFMERFHEHERVNIAWQRLLGEWPGLKALNPNIVLSLIDDLIIHIEKVMSLRTEIKEYVREHGEEISLEVAGKYLKAAERSEAESVRCIDALRGLKQDMLQSNTDTLVDINESIGLALEPYAADGKIKLELDLVEQLPKCWGNATKVVHIWTNLLRNSVYAIEEAAKEGTARKGKIVVKTQVVSEENEKYVEIVFSDNGSGIPQEMLNDGHLLQKSVTTKETGTGLGLYLIDQTIRSMGGTIDVQSEAGKGTTFTIRLPVRKDKNLEDEGLAQETVIYQTTVVSAQDMEIVNQTLMKIDQRLGTLIHIVHNTKHAESPIQVSVSMNGELIEVAFYDQGFGFAMPIEKAFEQDVGDGRGAGQGLYFVKQHFIEHLGGSIEVTSNGVRQEISRAPSGEALFSSQQLDSSWPKGVKIIARIPILNKPKEVIAASAAISPDFERIHTANLQDTLTYIQAQPQSQPLIVALGTSWIKGYEKGKYLQYDALNPLIGNIRSYCESKGIPFIVDDDDKLPTRIAAERTKEGGLNARVLVLAGEDAVKSDDFATLRNDEKGAFVVGINNQELTTDSYIRLMEMLTLALKLSVGLEITRDSTSIKITRDDKLHIYIFIPHAEPMDYEQLKTIYEVQKFA